MYLTDHSKQVNLISEMKQLRKDEASYEVHYHHPYTNQMWKSFFPKATNGKLGPKLLRHIPGPDTIEDQLRICLGEEVPENAKGLGIEWSARPDLWTKIMKEVDQHYGKYNRKQLKLFFNNLEINRRNVDRHLADKQDQADQYSLSLNKLDDLVWRSRKIRFKRFFVFG